MQNKLKKYKSTEAILAKIFEEGDQDGFLDGKRNNPYIDTVKSGKKYCVIGAFEKQYLCERENGERFLLYKEKFESTFVEVKLWERLADWGIMVVPQLTACGGLLFFGKGWVTAAVAASLFLSACYTTFKKSY